MTRVADRLAPQPEAKAVWDRLSERQGALYAATQPLQVA